MPSGFEVRILFLAFWYYLRGYVMIKATGFAAERLMNMLSYRGVYLWDIAPDKMGVSMKLPLDSMETLERCAEKTGCDVTVVFYGGLPAKLRPFRGRQVLLAGLLFFAAGLYLLSSFVWVVEVTGNERIAQEEILTYCEGLGLRPGAWKRGVDPAEITKALLADFSDISWVSVGMTGTDVTIQMAETIEKAPVVDKETPCDIIASADGLILQITAERGTPMVQPGDMVKKGDVLISSQVMIGLEGEAQHPEYVAADGVITARIWNRLTEELPLTYEEPVFVGEENAENFSLLFGGRVMDFIRPKVSGEFEQEVLYEKELALGDFKLPVAIKKEAIKPYYMEEKSRTIDEAKKELTEILREKTAQEVSPYGTIEKIDIIFDEYTDRVRAQGQGSMTERIGEKKPIEKGQEGIDGTKHAD